MEILFFTLSLRDRVPKVPKQRILFFAGVILKSPRAADNLGPGCYNLLTKEMLGLRI
jgi:hypothetical protein